MWLCPEHRQASRVVVLTDDVELHPSGAGGGGGALRNHNEGMVHELAVMTPLYSVPGTRTARRAQFAYLCTRYCTPVGDA